MGASSLSFFVCRQCGPRSGPTDPNCIKYFFHIHFLETKTPIRPAVRRLIWTSVVPMYQQFKAISRDKVHWIFKSSKLNVKIYTPNTPGVFAEGCIVFVFPCVRSSFSIFVRLLVRSFVLNSVN